jgi:hypothetical protein
MIWEIVSAVHGFDSVAEFEGYLSNLWEDEAGGQTPTLEEDRKQY